LTAGELPRGEDVRRQQRLAQPPLDEHERDEQQHPGPARDGGDGHPPLLPQRDEART
jgi:hypothetical protein